VTRRAFLLGRNTGSLRHCLACDEETGALQACDVQLMECCLLRHGFQVTLAEREANAGHISNQLNAVIATCAQEDTFVFYFSGHSLTRQRDFFLVLANDKDNFSNLYLASQLIAQLRNCKAGSKLLILDCCEAGQAVYQWTPANEDNFRVLAATNRTERSKEFDDLGAGVFTHYLYLALTEPELWVPDETGIVDKRGTIWVNELAKWLRVAIANYGVRQQRQVPLPELYGPFSQNILLAEGLPLHRHTFVSSARLGKLRTLLERANLPANTLQQCFDDVLGKIEPRRTPPPAYAGGEGILLDHLLDYWIETGHLQRANVPVPLLEFVARLADAAVNAPALRDWVDAEAASLGLTPATVREIGNTRDLPGPRTDQPLYLMIALAPNDANNQYYTVQAWFVDDRQKQYNVRTVDTRFTPNQMPTLLETALREPMVRTAREKAEKPLTLEFFLPKHLLDADPDAWTPGPAPEPDEPREPVLTYHYNVVVRSWERLPHLNNKWTGSWAAYWNKYEACRRCPPSAACVAWVTEHNTRYGSALDEGKCLFVLNFEVTDRRHLLTPLSQGVAMLLWSRKDWGDETATLLRQRMERHPLGELPDALREVRRKCWDESGEEDKHTGHLSLLWDDPHRLPEGREPQQLSNPLEF